MIKSDRIYFQFNSKEEASLWALLNVSEKVQLKAVDLKIHRPACISLVVWRKVYCYIQCISQKIKSIVPKSQGA